VIDETPVISAEEVVGNSSRGSLEAVKAAFHCTDIYNAAQSISANPREKPRDALHLLRIVQP